MTTRGTLALLGVLVVVAVWLVVELRPSRTTSTTAAEPLLGVRPTAVTSLELSRGSERLAALRHADGWRDPGGRRWPTASVGGVVETLAALRPLRVVDPHPADAAEYGLAVDATRLRLAGADGTTLLDVQLGERNPAGTGVYVRRTGRPEVLLVGAVIAWEVEKLRAVAPSRNP